MNKNDIKLGTRVQVVKVAEHDEEQVGFAVGKKGTVIGLDDPLVWVWLDEAAEAFSFEPEELEPAETLETSSPEKVVDGGPGLCTRVRILGVPDGVDETKHGGPVEDYVGTTGVIVRLDPHYPKQVLVFCDLDDDSWWFWLERLEAL
jgi:hypothetical protein